MMYGKAKMAPKMARMGRKARKGRK